MQQQLQLPPFQASAPPPPMRPQILVQPNPNPNNKVAQGIEAPTTFETYLITPMELNEIQLCFGHDNKPSHSPIVTKEYCEPSRGEARGSEVTNTSTTVDIEEAITSVTSDPRRTVTSVTENSRKVDTPVIIDSSVVMQDPSYP